MFVFFVIAGCLLLSKAYGSCNKWDVGKDIGGNVAFTCTSADNQKWICKITVNNSDPENFIFDATVYQTDSQLSSESYVGETSLSSAPKRHNVK